MSSAAPRLVNPKIVEERYTCPICLSLYNQPQILTICGHIFCKGCISRLNPKSCPLCRRSFYLFNLVEDPHLEDEINNAQIECLHCHEMCQVRETEAHYVQCPNRIVRHVVQPQPRLQSRSFKPRWISITLLVLLITGLAYLVGFNPFIEPSNDASLPKQDDEEQTCVFTSFLSALSKMFDHSVNTIWCLTCSLGELASEIYQQGTYLLGSLFNSMRFLLTWLINDFAADIIDLIRELSRLTADTISATFSAIWNLVLQLASFAYNTLFAFHNFILHTLNHVLAIEPVSVDSVVHELIMLGFKTLKSFLLLMVNIAQDAAKIVYSSTSTLVIEFFGFIYLCSTAVLNFCLIKIQELALFFSENAVLISSCIGDLVVKAAWIAFKMLFLFFKLFLVSGYLAFLGAILVALFNFIRSLTFELYELARRIYQLFVVIFIC